VPIVTWQVPRTADSLRLVKTIMYGLWTGEYVRRSLERVAVAYGLGVC